MTDLRYPHFADVRAALTGNRLAVWDAMLGFGACTGSELAAHIGWTVLSVRPRLTELRAMFHVVETGERRDGEHVFRAVSAAEAMTLHEEERRKYAIEERAQVRVTHPESVAVQPELSFV